MASASALAPTSWSRSASSIWPRPGLGLVNLASKCVIQCEIILVVSISWLYQLAPPLVPVVRYCVAGRSCS